MEKARQYTAVMASMPDSIITTETAVFGAGAWFLGKVLGPSADALGESLKSYLQSRVPKIFARAEQIAQAERLEVGEVPPGLLMRMVADASFSPDEPDITEWWANLFLEASTFASQSNKQAAFSDIMAVVGPREVAVLKELVEYYRFQVSDLSLEERKSVRVKGSLVQETLLFSVVKNFPVNDGNATEIESHFRDPKIPLPVRTLAWKIPFNSGDKLTWKMTNLPWYYKDEISFEILERARVLRFTRLEIPLMADQAAWVDLVGITALGIEFFEACTRQRIEGGI